MPGTIAKTDRKPQIFVYVRDGLFDFHGEGVFKDIADLHIAGVESVRCLKVYTVTGKPAKSELTRMGAELLADSVTQKFSVGEPPAELMRGAWVAHVMYNAGVTDAVGQTACKGISDLGISGVDEVHTSVIYIIHGHIGRKQVEEICRRLLANSVIQHFTIEKH